MTETAAPDLAADLPTAGTDDRLPWYRRIFGPLARSPLGLRRRILLIFTLGAVGLSAFLAFTTYTLTQSNVVQQRDDAAVDSARRNAQIVQSILRGEPTIVPDRQRSRSKTSACSDR